MSEQREVIPKQLKVHPPEVTKDGKHITYEVNGRKAYITTKPGGFLISLSTELSKKYVSNILRPVLFPSDPNINTVSVPKPPDDENDHPYFSIEHEVGPAPVITSFTWSEGRAGGDLTVGFRHFHANALKAVLAVGMQDICAFAGQIVARAEPELKAYA